MVVVDTSVVFKWFTLTEEKREEAKALLEKHLSKKQEIVVPDLILYEISNAWATKSLLKSEEIEENIRYLKTVMLTIIPVSFPFLIKCAQFTKKYHVSVYDASYVILAEEKNCNLITADEKFQKQVNLPFVTLL